MDERDFEKIASHEVQGAEDAVRKMLLYYASALHNIGVEDVRQYIATKISSMIDLSEEQYQFILTNLNSENNIIESLENSVKLLKSIEDKKELDIDSIKIVRQFLEVILKDYNESVK